MKDEEALRKIVEAAQLSREDNVLEIGPGEGALTRKLVEEAGRVLAVEKDEELAKELAYNFKFQISNQIQNHKFKMRRSIATREAYG